MRISIYFLRVHIIMISLQPRIKGAHVVVSPATQFEFHQRVIIVVQVYLQFLYFKRLFFL